MRVELVQTIWVPSQEEIALEREWITAQIEELGVELLNELARKAKEVREKAYMPYSGYKVGASLLTVSGKTYASCNAEVASYTETDHAERSTITKAISDGAIEKGGRRFIRAMAVCHEAESGPCGGCRQRIAEHADNALLLDVDAEGTITRITSLKTLLPYSFTPTDLGIE